MNMSPSATVWLTDVFLIVLGQQWSSTAQRNKLYQTLAREAILIDWFIAVFWSFCGICCHQEKYHQTSPSLLALRSLVVMVRLCMGMPPGNDWKSVQGHHKYQCVLASPLGWSMSTLIAQVKASWGWSGLIWLLRVIRVYLFASENLFNEGLCYAGI